MEAKDRIIVALDHNSAAESLNLVKLLKGRVGFFKVGSQLFSAEGPSIIKKIIEMGERVFLDLKFHDIPNTAAKSAQVAQKMGVSMLTIHTSNNRTIFHQLEPGPACVQNLRCTMFRIYKPEFKV